MKNVVIAGFARSPFHFARKGALARVRPDDLAAQVIAALVERSKIDPEEIEDVIVGCAFPEGEQGLNIGAHRRLPRRICRQRRRRHGQPLLRLVDAGDPHGGGRDPARRRRGVHLRRRRSMTPRADDRLQPARRNPASREDYPQAYISMGETAENVARKYQVTRADQEELAVESHQQGGRGAGRRQVQGRDRADQGQGRQRRAGWLHPPRHHGGDAGRHWRRPSTPTAR